MKLVRLELRRLPGIDAPFVLGEAELGSGLTVIHGPNGIGKSSLVRAVRAVLWPTLVQSEGLEIEAQFRAGETTWHVRRDGSLVRWTRNGEASAPPELPSVDLARSFLVSFEDIARAEAADFEGEIRRQMSGGFDFDALVAEQRWHEQSARGPRRELERARKETQEIRREQEALQAQVDELGELERQLAEAERQAAEQSLLEALIELRAARASLEDQLARRAALPTGMERLRGDERARLDKWRERESKLQQALRDAQDAEQRERQQLARLDLVKLPTEAQLGELGAARERWARAETRRDEAQRALAGREQACEAARAACPGELSEQALLRSDLLAGSELERLLRDAQALEADAAALEAELGLVPEPSSSAQDSDKLPAALAALRSWLNAPEPAAPLATRGHEVSIALALLALAVLALGLFVHPISFAGLLVVAFLAWRARIGTPASVTSDSRSAFQAQFDALGLGRVEWKRASVEARYNELDERRRKAEDERAAGARRVELLRRREALRPRETELEARRAALRQALGLEVEVGTFDLATFASAVTAFRRANEERARAEGEQRSASDESAAEAGRFHALLTPFVKQTPADALAATPLLSSLASRAAEAKASQQKIERAALDRTRAERESAELQLENAKFWSELALEPGDERGLRQRSEALAEWRELQKEIDHATRQVEALARKLGPRQGEAQAEESELRQRLDAARKATTRKDELIGTIGARRNGLETARNQRRFEKAVADETRCRLELERELARARGQALATLLLDEVRGEFERDSQPRVLQRADVSLRSFTLGRYGLRGLATGQLRACDAETGRELELAQLSTGTRAQLLVALHLAFAAEVPTGHKPPQFLDDSFATSDAARQRAIGEALLRATASEDLQCFCLTREPGDVAWLAEAKPAAVRTLDLAAVRGVQAPKLARAALALPKAPPLPDPAKVDALAFGEQLGVPPLEGQAPIEALHLFHVMRDELVDLRRLLELRIERVGVLRELQADGAQLLDVGVRARVEAWIRFTESVFAAWRVGRGRPLDREVLRHRDLALSDVAFEGVEPVAREVGWDAKRLVAELEVRKLGKQKLQQQVRDRLREFLEREGHLDPASVLEREQAWARVLTDEPGLASTFDAATLRARFDWLWNLLEPTS